MEEKGSQSLEYFVKREVLDELCLDEVAQKGTWSTKPTLGDQVKDSLRCSVPRLKHILLTWIPVLSWLPRYSIRENALGDLISGCSVGIMHLPQGMAYALLASLRPVYGLYTSLFPVLVYFIFGTSRHISIGTFAVISIMVGSVTERLAPDSNFIVNGTNGTETVDIDTRDAYRVQVACALTVLAGLFQILLGVVRFGFVVTYLSEPLIRGYTTGSACHVCVSQLKYLFGVSPSRFTGPLSLVYVIAATVITHFCDLPSKYNIDVVGEIPSGLKAPSAPDTTFFSSVIGDAFAVAIVGFAINISLGKTFGLKYGYKVDSNQELVAVGLSNTIGGFFHCYCVTSSLSRSLVQESTGGKTQVAGVISSIIVLITVLKIGPLFEDLPKAVLSTIVFVNLKGMFKQFMDVPLLWKTNKVDLLVWLVTFISTVVLNLDMGLAVAIAFSMLTFIFRTQLPRYSILGNLPGTELYLDTDTYKEVKEIPGIKIFRSSATIYYTNAEMFLDTLQEKSGIEIGKLLSAKKKRDAKQKRKQEKEKKKTKKEAKKQVRDPKLKTKGERNGTSVAFSMTETATDGLHKGQVNLAYQPDITMSDSDSDAGYDHITEFSGHGDEAKEQACDSGTHSIILDISTTSFVDTVTVKTLKNIFRDFGQVDLDICLAGCQACVVEQLEAADFFSASIPKTRLFITVHDAVLYILKKRGKADFVLDVSRNTQM
uniref:Solute carrier family 26 member 6 n=1 Tax=Oreochromis niloticus TaxID=8128 RepID=A0A669B263_ORENI